jgi:hypothetical protein
MNRKETATICAILKSAFPVWNTTPETIEMYHAMLQDIPVEVAMRAVQDWVLTSEKFPTIAGIRKKCAEVSGVLSPTASEAWAEVNDVCDRYGIYAENRPSWSHPLIRKTVKALGYQHICQTENITTVRAQFNKMYNELKEKEDSEIVLQKSFELGAGSVALPYSTVLQSETPSLRA